jgi:hypothetical protein
MAMVTLTKGQATRRPRWTPALQYALVAAVLVVGAACAGPAEIEAPAAVEIEELAGIPGVWPPPPSEAFTSDSKVPVLGEGDAEPKFCGDTTIYNDNRLTVAAEGEARVGYVMCDGEFELPYNIFTITTAGDGYVNNAYQVVSFDDSHTRIKMVGSENHRLVYEVDPVARYAGLVDFIMTPTYEGTRVLYNDKIYEIRGDGFYVGDQQVSRFAN